MENYDASSWADLAVSGNWQMQDYGIPRYLSDSYAFNTDACPKVEEDTNETGSYRTTFVLLEGWDGRQIFINFDGVDSAFYLWINGQMAGFSKDSRLLASGQPWINLSAHHFTAQDLAQSVLGSAGRGPGRLEKYQLQVFETRFGVRLRPFSSPETPEKLSKQNWGG